jgi:hypothetical protein
MRIIGSSNNYPFSWLIRKLTGENISHIAIVFDDLIVFHSTPVGTHTSWLTDFVEKNKIHRTIPLYLGLVSEEQVYFTIISKRKKKKYDWMGIFYQGLMRLRRIVFRIPLPINNLWQDGNKDYCIEVLNSIDWDAIKIGLQSKFNELRLDMMSPGEVMFALEKMIGDDSCP